MKEKLLQVLVILAVTSAGCSLIRVNGKPLGGGAAAADDRTSGKNDDRSESSGHGAQQQAAASVRAPISEPLRVQAAFGPNPLVIAGQPGTTDKDVLSLHGDRRSSCSGWVTSGPAMVLDIAQPSQGLEVTAPGAEIADRHLRPKERVHSGVELDGPVDVGISAGLDLGEEGPHRACALRGVSRASCV